MHAAAMHTRVEVISNPPPTPLKTTLYNYVKKIIICLIFFIYFLYFVYAT